ncbi:EscC/YscC/HrcC family type III secretion system outer membrane ring protein [Trinickia dabaoshanensis]|uniref:Type 3 secretion system secretin n=1 Tax=Trinickia dabaoshanensis TaxID=564714 RepID=A0A2N7VLY3_9BURK|nr:type III secretion system outer membrane ring subunit SctC [Trinickia dabaoshanensis]PMS18169.1 EscC/YscC/HrcC family type III secretion system outer membrane ring protein [Trinickia dabaoshanensis]
MRATLPRHVALVPLVVCAASAFTSTNAAWGAELQWRERPYTIVADGKKVSDFIRELAAAQGVTAVIDDKVEGTISGNFSGTPLATLRTVCATYGLTYYYDGSLLYIGRATDAQTQVFPIPRGSAGELSRTLQAMRIPDKRFPLIISDRENTIYASGPQRYIELVRQAIQTLADPSRGLDRAEIHAFPLRYAFASDFDINRSGKAVKIPGIATILSQLYGKNGGRNGLPGGGRITDATRQVKLASGDTIGVPRIGMGGAAGSAMSNGGYDGGVAGDDTSSSTGGLSLSPSYAGAPVSLPQIVADSGTNSVLIRDVPEHMPQYAQLISTLDARPRLIELSLTIIDIDENALDSVGVDWRLHTKHGDLQFGNGTNPPLTFNNTTEAGQTGATVPAGLALTASVGGSMLNYFLARINALENKGQAKTLSKPRVLTLDNNEAILENLTEFYVQVAGYQDSSLYGITTGTSVKITPRIVTDAGRPSVMMSINIDDGQLNPNITVTNVPAVTERNIVTKAMIDEGKSLLIAGFNNEDENVTKSGIPFLKDIPWVGNLFKYTTKTGDRTDRFYLLTPRVVELANAYEPGAAPLDGQTTNPGAPYNPSASPGGGVNDRTVVPGALDDTSPGAGTVPGSAPARGKAPAARPQAPVSAAPNRPSATAANGPLGNGGPSAPVSPVTHTQLADADVREPRVPAVGR